MRKIIIALFIGSLMWGCSDYLDINEDPNRLRDVELSSLLPNIIERTSNTQYNASLTTSQACYQLGSYFQHFQPFNLSSTWSGIYLSGLKNAQDLMNRAEVEESPHYAGIAKVLFAYNLGLATDCWEDVPYTNALLGTDDVDPSFDSQETVYEGIFTLLDEAIQDLNAENSLLSPGSDDMIYGGDLTQWIKAANALKARYALHLKDKDDSYRSMALQAVNNAFSSNADDLQLEYNGIRRNPYHTGIALANNTGNFTFTHSYYFIDLLREGLSDNGDPRLSALADKGMEDEFIGIHDYDNEAAENTVDFSETTWHSTEQAPVVWCSYSELKFIEAEAALDQDPGRAYNAYLEGIRANLDKVGVAESDRDAYLQDPMVDVGSGNLTLGHILRQKYITLFLNPEAWVDMRRVQFDVTDIYQGLEIPERSSQIFDPAQRALYPIEEVSRNGEEVSRVSKDFNELMWRDQ